MRHILGILKDLETCAESWHKTLLDKKNREVLLYVLGRIPNNLVKSQKIGLCLSAPGAAVNSLHITKNKKIDKNNPIFWNRITIPIVDGGYTVGFGARQINDDGFAKYLNSPDSDYYRKAQTLYNLWEARKEIRKTGFAILTEGYFDVLGIRSVGIQNCVASCGTALTQDQVYQLSYFCDAVLIWYDGDTAGRAAAKKAKKLLGSNGFSVANLTINNLDPFDVCEKYGRKRLLKKVKEKTDGIL